MEVKVLGIQQQSGTSKKTGNPYSGYFLHYCYQREKIVGMAVHEVYVDINLFAPIIAAAGNDPGKLLGKQFQVDFDDRGYLQTVRPL